LSGSTAATQEVQTNARKKPTPVTKKKTACSRRRPARNEAMTIAAANGTM